jgi:thymidylate synthase (FAD)
MRIIDPSFQIESRNIVFGNALQDIERAGRTCYKSEEKMTVDTAEAFVARIMKSGHHSVIEHVNITVRFITNRGVTHEIVRHRLASYSQESTRYCNYSKEKFGEEITLIRPYWWEHVSGEIDTGALLEARGQWKCAMENAETRYFEMLKCGLPAQAARGVLPNDLKTEIVMTANLREWLHFFKLRTAAAAHPDLRLLSVPLLAMFRQHIPIIYDEVRAVEVKRR